MLRRARGNGNRLANGNPYTRRRAGDRKLQHGGSRTWQGTDVQCAIKAIYRAEHE